MNDPQNEKFVPAGAIVVVPGVVQDAAGNILRNGLNVQTQGECEPLINTREGLAKLHALLMEAAVAIANKMVVTPSAQELNANRIVTARSLPKMPSMPRGFKQ